MTDQEQSLEAAKWLAVGFIKSWSMYMVRQRLEELGISADQQFFPRQRWGWTKNHPVRAFVSSNYPKLAEFLDRATPEKAILSAAQIVKLECKNDKNDSVISRQDATENEKIKAKYRRTATTSALVTNQRKSHQRGAWNTVKA